MPFCERPLTFASPRTTRTLLAFMAEPTPPTSFLTTLFLRSTILPKSNVAPRRAHSVLVAVLGVVVDFRAVKQRLGRDAAFVEAYAAQFAFLEQHDVQPFGSGAFRSHVASGTSADNC